MPRFREVCTSPGMSPLMACTPLGRQVSMHTARRVLSLSRGSGGVSPLLRLDGSAPGRWSGTPGAGRPPAPPGRPGQPPRRTPRSGPGSRWGWRCPCCPPPPRSGAGRVRAETARRQRPSRRLALARPRWISVPECPPVRPPTETVSAVPERAPALPAERTPSGCPRRS